MISPNIIYSTGSEVLWSIRVVNNNSANTSVTVETDTPTDFTLINSQTLKGSFDSVTGIWTIGDMSVGEVAYLYLTFELSSTPPSFPTVYDFNAEVFGTDTTPADNVLNDQVTYELVTGAPLAGSNPGETSSLEVDVSLNDTECTQGDTEWRIDNTSLDNLVLQSWDETTGIGNFTRIDDTLPGSFSYDLYCVSGASEYLISEDVQYIIHPQIQDKSIYDHALVEIEGSDLEPDEVAFLEGLGYDLVTDATWIILYNADGDITGGIPKYKEFQGYLCDGTGTVVFIWTLNGELSYTLTDGTDFIGDVATLESCCC